MKQITAMKKSIAFMTIQAYYLTYLKLQWFWLVHLNKGGFILKLIVKLLIVTFLLTTTGFVYGQTKNDNSSKSDTSSIQAPIEKDDKVVDGPESAAKSDRDELTGDGGSPGESAMTDSSKSDTSSIQAPDEEDSKEGDIQEDLKTQGASPDDDK